MPCCSTKINEVSRQYIREITEVLAALDLTQLKEFYGRWAESMELPPIPDDKKLEEDMYLMILELPGLAHLHQTAQEWLQKRGLVVEIREVNCGKHHGGDNQPDGGTCCRKA